MNSWERLPMRIPAESAKKSSHNCQHRLSIVWTTPNVAVTTRLLSALQLTRLHELIAVSQ
jgi:hypothetical protein